MQLDAYRSVLARGAVRRVLLLSVLVRIPMWAGNVVLTLHVVGHLHRSYGAAGLLVGVATVAAAVSSPWRGRIVDRLGLRRAVLPSVLVQVACWSIAPFLPYWPLFALAALSGLFIVPTFSIVRQALMHAVPDEHRTSMLAIDSVVVEVSFMIGPVLGVLLATYVPTSWAMFGCEMASALGGLLIWAMNPPLRADDPAGNADRPGTPSQRWLTPAVIGVLVAAMASTVVLGGTDVGVVAALRHMGHQAWIGWVLALWGLGSALGGLIYGALHRTVPVYVLLGALSALTIPAALAPNPVVLAALLVVAGLFCAPTVTATVDALSHAVPERRRGEALGWHGSAMTTGSALGAPFAGVAIDHIGWGGGFVLPGLIGLAAAAVGLVAARNIRSRRATQLADGSAAAAPEQLHATVGG